MSRPSPHHRRRRSSILVSAGDLERLIAECDETLRADPTCLHTRAVRGYASMKAKRWEQAARDFSGILDARPDDEHARFSRGMALFKSARVDDAHRDFTRVLELNPAHVMARYARAGCYNSEGEYNQAIQEYWLALRHDEESARAPLRADGHHWVEWSCDTNPSGSTSMLTASTSTSDRSDARVMQSTVATESTTVATAPRCSSVTASGGAEAATVLASPTRPEARRAARKVVQVRVNLSQFAVPADQPISASTPNDAGSKGSNWMIAKPVDGGAKVTTKQRGDHLQTDMYGSAGTCTATARPVAIDQQPPALDRGALPQARATPRLVRRVTVVL